MRTSSFRIVIQVRMSSSRLPGKSMLKFGSELLIDSVVKRAVAIDCIERVTIVTTNESSDDILENYLRKYPGLDLIRGSKLDVRSRFLQVVSAYQPDFLVRITADDPFKDPALIAEGIRFFVQNDFDYVCNFMPYYLPYGMDYEIFRTSAFLKSIANSSSPNDVEHVTPFLRENSEFRHHFISGKPDLRGVRLTIDTYDDYVFCSSIMKTMEDKDPSNLSWEMTRWAIKKNMGEESIHE